MGGWERSLLLVEFLGIFTVRKSESRAEKERERERERTEGAGYNNCSKRRETITSQLTHTHTK